VATSNYALRLQTMLKSEAEKLAVSEGTTLNQFINVAVAEKIAAIHTVEYLQKRAARGNLQTALEILSRAGTPGNEGEGDKIL
jgi:hypothetical protein